MADVRPDSPLVGQATVSAKPDPSLVLEVRNLSKSFGPLSVLSDVSFRVYSGQTVCILGPSGTGKSTLLRCINWLERPDSGEVFLRGDLVGYKHTRQGVRTLMSERDLSKTRARMAMVFQHFNLWPHLTVLGNIIESPIHVMHRRREDVVAETDRLLRKVGLSDKRDVYPNRLSGGQKQRVGIARALAMHPDIVLFDEPTSSLDPELVGEVLTVMKGLARDGSTMIVVTHEMAFAREVADWIVFLDQGRVCESVTANEFFRSPATERARQFLQRFL